MCRFLDAVYNRKLINSSLGYLAPGKFAARQAGKTTPNPPSKLA